MPFFPAPNIMTPQDVQGPLLEGQDEIPIAQPGTPSFGESFGAGFDRENIVNDSFEKENFDLDLQDARSSQGEIPDDWDPLANIPEEHMQDHLIDRYLQFGQSPEEWNVVRQQIDREMADAEKIQGFGGFLGMATGSLLSPFTLVPGTVVLKAGRLGMLGKKVAGTVKSALAVGGSVAAEEMILKHNQLTRTMEEVEMNTLAATAMGGFFGFMANRLPKNLAAAYQAELRNLGFAGRERKVIVDEEGNIKIDPTTGNSKSQFTVNEDCI